MEPEDLSPHSQHPAIISYTEQTDPVYAPPIKPIEDLL